MEVILSETLKMTSLQVPEMSFIDKWPHPVNKIWLSRWSRIKKWLIVTYGNVMQFASHYHKYFLLFSKLTSFVFSMKSLKETCQKTILTQLTNSFKVARAQNENRVSTSPGKKNQTIVEMSVFAFIHMFTLLHLSFSNYSSASSFQHFLNTY